MKNNKVAESGIGGYIKDSRMGPGEIAHDWFFCGGK